MIGSWISTSSNAFQFSHIVCDHYTLYSQSTWKQRLNFNNQVLSIILFYCVYSFKEYAQKKCVFNVINMHMPEWNLIYLHFLQWAGETWSLPNGYQTQIRNTRKNTSSGTENDEYLRKNGTGWGEGGRIDGFNCSLFQSKLNFFHSTSKDTPPVSSKQYVHCLCTLSLYIVKNSLTKGKFQKDLKDLQTDWISCWVLVYKQNIPGFLWKSQGMWLTVKLVPCACISEYSTNKVH